MKKVFTFILTTSLVLVFTQSIAQTIWTGPNITFTKAGGADWTQEANQDRLTDSVWITRANNKGIFNIVMEDVFEGDGAGPTTFGPSPKDTEWAFGNTSDGIENLDFTTWIVATTVNDLANEANPSSLINQDMVLHLISDDIYLNIKFLSWASGNMGMGGFSYERNSDETTDVDEIDLKHKKSLTVFPNPADNYLLIQDLNNTQNVEILDLLGKTIYKNSIDSSDKINTSLFPAGVYYIKLEDGRSTTFLKH